MADPTKPKIVDVEGVPHRWRRGKLVPIPAEWRGQVPAKQTINQRVSKLSSKERHRRKASNKKRRVIDSGA